MRDLQTKVDTWKMLIGISTPVRSRLAERRASSQGAPADEQAVGLGSASTPPSTPKSIARFLDAMPLGPFLGDERRGFILAENEYWVV